MDSYKYADVIIPGALEGTYTYSLSGLNLSDIRIGSRVIVSFGKSRLLIGIILRVHNETPDYSGIKKIAGIPEIAREISGKQLKFWTWVSEYYICNLGEVMDAALPAGLKMDKSGSLKYSPRKITVVALAKDYTDDELNIIIDGLSRSPSGKHILLTLLDFYFSGEKEQQRMLAKNELLKIAGASSSALKLLVNKGILSERAIEARPEESQYTTTHPRNLSKEQEGSFNAILEGFRNKQVVLLKGVTSSGKTEIYVHLIRDQLKQGKQVLYLLPEIALTSQIISRLRSYFGSYIGVYHSRFSDNERVEVWLRTGGNEHGEQFRIILGVRSALFLPYDKLGLIIVDEEHDTSYKQQDPAPRYNARDSALILAKIYGANVLLGSATPSIESVFNCKSGKYKLVELNTRYGDVKMPEVQIADSREALRRKIMVSDFTPQLIAATEETLAAGEQAVFFRNRRGYSTVIMCNECGWVPLCTDCSVSMTYHKGINRLKCHYCGKSSTLPARCGNCSSTDLRMKGFGTEKISDQLSLLFPGYRVQRMDYDTTRRKGSFESIIKRFEKGDIDMLVGTQMISKGLDFENLTLVAVLNIDSMLFFPDFRAPEKCYQMIEQVSGRAGRRKKRGKVVLQTADPSNSIIRQAINHEFWAMYKCQLEERMEFSYPPYTRLITIYLRHRERSVVKSAANMLAGTLRGQGAYRVLGPEFPVIERIQDSYIMTILIKIDRNENELGKIKRFIRKSMRYVLIEAGKTGLRVYADVDPA
ncbi:MAG: primosomal protein N' [Marinilabiliaceae bacterium]|jgi:primosomal protein N' (replication factor Y)|nr:primosomal protein N' [Marinilabiliaceae bacterium]